MITMVLVELQTKTPWLLSHYQGQHRGLCSTLFHTSIHTRTTASRLRTMSSPATVMPLAARVASTVRVRNLVFPESVFLFLCDRLLVRGIQKSSQNVTWSPLVAGCSTSINPLQFQVKQWERIWTYSFPHIIFGNRVQLTLNSEINAF